MITHEIIQGDCLEVMPSIPSGSMDMILADLPYGTTACKWDTIIPLDALWAEYKRIIKKNGAIVLTASQPFTSALVMSNPKWFKYEWIWFKTAKGNFMQANYQPLKRHENILVFSPAPASFAGSSSPMAYYPTRTQGITDPERITRYARSWEGRTSPDYEVRHNHNDMRFPISVLTCGNSDSTINKLHPTQKPVALMEYLIRTYTNEGETVLDNTMGSGTTGVACINTNRHFIGIEKDETYYQIAADRIEKAQQTVRQADMFSEVAV